VPAYPDLYKKILYGIVSKIPVLQELQGIIVQTFEQHPVDIAKGIRIPLEGPDP
jgi:hypothetical protein